MEKETLEEAMNQNGYVDSVNDTIWREGVKFGAKWQAERMYSEEDLREAFKQSRQALIFEKDMPAVYESFEDWFEQFKKK